jgi:hypothetical protein
MEEAADDETVFGDSAASPAGYIQGLKCMVGHSAGIPVVAVALDCEEVAALKEVDDILHTFSIG